MTQNPKAVQPGKQAPIDKLLDVMAALRTPGTGCPWDLEQTFETIAPYTIEEAYEVADAIARGDTADLREELGDLLLQVVYHARIAEEQALFSFDDVAQAIVEKMIRRHPHVFGSAEERAAGAQAGAWEKIKTAEKEARLAARTAAGLAPDREDDREDQGALSGVPENMPALMRAGKLQSKAAKAGFDWPDLKPVMAKMREELAELDDALAQYSGDQVAGGEAPAKQDLNRQRQDDGGLDKDRLDNIEEEFGDLLFVMVNVARHLSLDAECTLRRANAKFTRRFRGIERHLAASGRDIEDATLEEMDAIWNAIKREEKGRAP